MRGKPRQPPRADMANRSIPACAGETLAGAGRGGKERVYPRVCGGNSHGHPPPPSASGLSPRVRGKPNVLPPSPVSAGSIPACAGETIAPDAVARRRRVYPRVCGGNPTVQTFARRDRGLSPRVRGKRLGLAQGGQVGRSIPACAGETRFRPATGGGGGVYPRVCGGNASSPPCSVVMSGLSPRVRGKRRWTICASASRRSIPACAGETGGGHGVVSCCSVYPRVCGGNTARHRQRAPPSGLSPRVRGKHQQAAHRGFRMRSIPACAGETGVCVDQQGHPWVYPRVCGGNRQPRPFQYQVQGLSPRVRGKPIIFPNYLLDGRSIPACAGETQPVAGGNLAE